MEFETTLTEKDLKEAIRPFLQLQFPGKNTVIQSVEFLGSGEVTTAKVKFTLTHASVYTNDR